MAIYKDSKELKAATGADLMLRSAFKLELENIEARIENDTFYHPTPETIIDYLKPVSYTHLTLPTKRIV